MAKSNDRYIPYQSASTNVAFGLPGITSKLFMPCKNRMFCQMPYSITMAEEPTKKGRTFLRSFLLWMKLRTRKYMKMKEAKTTDCFRLALRFSPESELMKLAIPIAITKKSNQANFANLKFRRFVAKRMMMARIVMPAKN